MSMRVHNIVGLILGSVYMVIPIVNFISIRNHIDIEISCYAWLDYVTFILGFLMIILSVSRQERIRIPLRKRVITFRMDSVNMNLQFIGLLFIISLCTLDNYRSQWILSLMMLLGLMGIKYRLIGLKGLIACIIYFVVLIEYSAYADGKSMRGIFVIIFAIFFYGIALILYADELSRYASLAQRYHTKSIKIERRLDKIIGKTLDPAKMGFTPREAEVLRTLCESRASNHELAEALGIKEQTVKTHLKNIFDKSGADDRYQLIDLFKNSYIE